MIAFLFLAFSLGQAQTSRIISKIEKLQKENTSLGRELWFTLCKNADFKGIGQYYTLYITSPKNTVANIHAYGGFAFNVRQAITANQVFQFDIPIQFEMETSDVVEDKAIHVWSEDADLSAYVLSHNSNSSDGMLVIPTTGWGTSYVVAGYESLQLGYSPGFYDYPSEFAIVANQNYTHCTIKPHDDIRATNSPTVIHKAGIPFDVDLMRGQCVQYMTIPATEAETFDVTGTIVTSNLPVGVIGASQCSNVPADYITCDHVCDMLPPIRTWAQTYQSVPFAGRKSGDSFLMIGTKAGGQEIWRNSSIKYTITGTNGYFIDPQVTEASTWTSDAPFMLIQYINSSSWESEHNGANPNPKGDPSMVVINSVEQYGKDVVFQTPSINTYINYVNVMVPNGSIAKTKFDNIPISSFQSKAQTPVPFSNYTAFQISNVLPGTHEVKSDSGIGVYIYGYGTNESYAWSGALGLRTINDPDTIAPIATITGDCFNSLVNITDNQTTPPASEIAEMKLDSLFNMQYSPDQAYEIGIASTATYYQMNVVDSTKEAYLRVEIHDYAGNRTMITSTYSPQAASITPSVLNFGAGAVGVTACKDILISNTGKVPYTWKSLQLALANLGFVISPFDSSAIPVGGSRTVHICYTPKTGGLSSDTLLLSDGCITTQAIVTGTGGQPDFTVIGEDFGCQIVGSTTVQAKALITNVSATRIQIDDIQTTDPNFTVSPPITFPIFVNAGAQLPVSLAFKPNVVGNSFTATLKVKSNTIGERDAIITGCGIAPGLMITKDLDSVSVCGAAISFADTIISTGTTGTTVSKIILTDTNFKVSTLRNANGRPVGEPPVSLTKNDTIIAFLNFFPPPKATGMYSTKLFVISDRGDTTNSVTTNIRAIYREITIKKDSAVMGSLPYGSPIVYDTVTYCNEQADSVLINGALLAPGIHNKSFSIKGYLVGGVTKTPPFSLATGECLSIAIGFDASVSTDSLQTALYTLSTNACTPLPAGRITAQVTIGAPSAQGFDLSPAILSCDKKPVNVTVTNPAVTGTVTIKSVSMRSGANFIAAPPSPATVGAGKSASVPVVFSPTPSTQASTYRDTVIIIITNIAGKPDTLYAPISASSGGINTKISSSLSATNASAGSGTVITMPIDISMTKNGVTENTSNLGITHVKLTYSYNTGLLQPLGDRLSVAYVPANGWTYDNSSVINDATGTLTLLLNNSSPLEDGMTSLGSIKFYPTITRSGTKETPVSLVNIQFITDNDSLAASCINAQPGAPTDFSIVYNCGDSALAHFLETGNTPAVIKPARPDPVSKSSGGVVSFEYAIREAGNVSLVLYDALGRQSAAIISGAWQPEGSYRTEMNIRNLASGIYIYRFQLGSGTAITGTISIEN